jgi:NADPH:quinone reductase-like Zn-dependent oxidoreductase
MRSVQFTEYGGPEVLRVVDRPVPEPGAGQVRVAVRVAGVNPVDWKIRAGLFAGGKPLSRPRTPGQELAGIVDAVGPGAEFSVGDEVFGWSSGGAYAEYALAGVVAAKPDALSWQDAAALPVAGEAALRGLRQLAVQPGEVLLIHGASGAVGSLAAQLAGHQGVRVIGTAGSSSLEHVRSLGATPVPYGEGLVERVRELTDHVDAVFDTAGHGALPDSIELRGGTDRVLTIADPAADSLGVQFSSGSTGDASTLRELADEFVAGRLRLQHAATFELTQAAEAQQLSQTGHARGKITLTVR